MGGSGGAKPPQESPLPVVRPSSVVRPGPYYFSEKSINKTVNRLVKTLHWIHQGKFRVKTAKQQQNGSDFHRKQKKSMPCRRGARGGAMFPPARNRPYAYVRGARGGAMFPPRKTSSDGSRQKNKQTKQNKLNKPGRRGAHPHTQLGCIRPAAA